MEALAYEKTLTNQFSFPTSNSPSLTWSAEFRTQPIPDVNCLAGYYEQFISFRNSYPGRESHLSMSILKEIPEETFILKDLRILDVGSSDGHLISKLLETSRNQTNASLHLTCIEPCMDAFAVLQETALRWPFRSDLFNITADAFLASRGNIEKFDLIVCSHVYYHFQDYPSITKSLLGLLRPHGRLLIVLDSHDSPIYELIFSTVVRSEDQNNQVHPCGSLLSVADLARSLRYSEIGFFQQDLSSKLFFPSRSSFERVVEFLSRQDLRDSHIFKHAETCFIKEIPFSMPWKEGIIVLNAPVDLPHFSTEGRQLEC